LTEAAANTFTNVTAPGAIAAVQAEGVVQIGLVQAEGADQIGLVEDEGTEQLGLIAAELAKAAASAAAAYSSEQNAAQRKTETQAIKDAAVIAMQDTSNTEVVAARSTFATLDDRIDYIDLSSKVHLDYLTQNISYLMSGAENTKPVKITAAMTAPNTDLTVSITPTRNNTNYAVITEISTITGGTTGAGNLVISAKQANGFKIKYTGDATAVTAICTVIGGMI